MFCSPSFNKKALIGINIAYVLVAFILIGVATYGKNSDQMTSLPIVGGIMACGIFLLLVAVLGVLATFKQSQLMLFCYMIILLVIFVLQFSISCACLGVDKEREQRLAKKAWDLSNYSPFDAIHDAEKHFECCGYDDDDQRRNPINIRNESSEWWDEIKWCISEIDSCKVNEVTTVVPPTETVPPTPTVPPTTTGSSVPTATTEVAPTKVSLKSRNLEEWKLTCPTCESALDEKIDDAFNASGGLGLFFAFTELFAIILAYIYRKQCGNITTMA